MKTNSIAKIAGGLTLMAASSAAMASVVNTVHNLGSSGTANHTDSTTEICIFCHTPHGGDQSVTAPLWNRSVSSTGVYTRFSSLNRITFDASEAPVGSVSIACLSCHDGTQAMDAVINGPGGGPNSNSVSTQASTHTGIGGFKETNFMSTLAASDNGSLSGDMIYLGTDLRNDHPISMQYGGGGITTGGATNAATTDPDFAQVVGSGAATGGYGLAAASNATGSSNNIAGSGTGAVNYNAGRSAWYVDTGTAGYQVNDFPLYTRDTGAGNEPFVECGTCHDPHSANSTFLRLPGGNVNSQVCLTCHAK